MKRTYLKLNKQRFHCKVCGQTFVAKTSLVDEGCFISKDTKCQIAIKASEAMTLKAIAQDTAVSSASVQRVINKEAKAFNHHVDGLPKHLSFDEFKFAKGRMAFEYINVETGEILDIIASRFNVTIKDHFITHYSWQERKQVETVTIDMNAGYVSVINELFPNAKIIIDRFHLTQLVNRSMNKTRIQIMNQFHTSKNEDQKKYRRLKRYWRLLLKRETDLSSTTYRYYKMFGQRLESSVVQECLSYSETLRINHALYQQILRAFGDRDFNTLEQLVTARSAVGISSTLRTSLKTLRKHLPYIANSFIYSYNNGRIEGINNKIKVLNRVAYGYRNFNNYRSRIMIHFKFKAVEPSQQKTNIQAA